MTPSINVTCLIVDDLPENLTALSAVVAGPDVQVVTARSGAEALELLLVHDVALAILDVQMPDMDGFELAELMRGAERTRHVPLMFVTAGGSDWHRVFKGYDTGAVDFLQKPVEPHILRNKASVFFQLHRQKIQLMHDLRERTETLRLNEMFVAVLGHDLRTPLGALMTGAHLVQLKTDDASIGEIAGRMVSSGRRMNRMIEDLLDFSRARVAGGIPIQRCPTTLGALVDRVVDEHRSNTPARRIEVETMGDLGGEWDADRLVQAMSNLVGNAVQHGEADGTVTIRVDGTSPDVVRVAVINAGAIDQALLPGIFDPFRSGERRTHAGGGLGLGLYIAQQIVQAHQGTIAAQSHDGRVQMQVALPRTAIETVKF